MTTSVDDNWSQNWEGNFEPVVPAVKKSQASKMQSGVPKGKKFDPKMATHGFLSGEVTHEEVLMQKKVMRGTETVLKISEREEMRFDTGNIEQKKLKDIEFKPEELQMKAKDRKKGDEYEQKSVEREIIPRKEGN